LAALACLCAAGATTLPELSGDEEIEQAQAIFRGRVEQVNAAREQTARGNPIVTTVRFTRLAVYKGDVNPMLSLRFLGGKVGDTEMRVDGMPQFEVGQEYILFVTPGQNRACPVVGWTQGSLKVDRKDDVAGTVPVKGVSESLLRSPAARARVVRPAKLGLPEFEQMLRARVQQLSGKK
jgi:hypothetical protein